MNPDRQKLSITNAVSVLRISFFTSLDPAIFSKLAKQKGYDDPNPPKKYFCSGTRLGVSFWVNKSRDIVFLEKFDLKSVWAKA